MDEKRRLEEYSVDEILAEAQTMRAGAEKPQKPDKPAPEPAAEPPAHPEIPAMPQPAPGGNIRMGIDMQDAGDSKEPKGFFARRRAKKLRRKKEIQENESSEEVYYGMQLKPISEYCQGYNETGEEPVSGPTPEYSALFDNSQEDDLDEEIAERFKELRSERRQRVRQAMEQAGIDFSEVESEYSFIQPLPKAKGIDSEKEIFSNSSPYESDSPILKENNIPGLSAEKSSDDKEKSVQFTVVHSDPISESETTEEKIDEDVSAHSDPTIHKDNRRVTVDEILAEVESTRKDAKLISEPIFQVVSEQEPQEKTSEREISEKAEENVDFHEEKSTEVSQVSEEQLQEKEEAEQSETPPLNKNAKQEETITENAEEDEHPFVRVPKPKSEQASSAKPYEHYGIDYRIQDRPIHLVNIDAVDSALREEARYYENLSVQKMDNRKADLKKQKKHHSGKFRFQGEEKENESLEEIPQEPEEELDDYNNPSDAPSIFHDIGGSMRELFLRVIVTGFCTILLFLLGIVKEYGAFMPADISKSFNGATYLILNIIFFCIAVIFCIRTVLNGLKALTTLQTNSDSGVAFAVLAVLIQNISAFFYSSQISNGTLHVYSLLAVLALALNSAGKLSMVRRIYRNFRFVASPEPKYTVRMYDDYNTSLKLARGCVMDAPAIAYQQKTHFLSRFLQNSYEPDPSEISAQTIAPIGCVCSLALCIACLVISKDVPMAITAFAASACVLVPFTAMLGGNMPISRACMTARKCGAMLVGYPAVEKFSAANAVMVDAKDLFPKGTVVLNGIKTFAGQRIDEAIVDATALMCAVGGPLSDVFDQIIKSRREILPEIDSPAYEDERGVIGWVSGRRILVGNRDLLAAHHITPPSRDYEEKYVVGGRQVTYLAVGGELVAMFILSYNSDRRRAKELQRMELNGISLIVRTCDTNITPKFLSECFGLDIHSVRVLPEDLGKEYQKVAEPISERTGALLATKGKVTTMMRMVSTCVNLRSRLSFVVALENISVILGYVLIAFMACYQSLYQISALSLFVYELFWIFAILLIPKIRKL